MAKIRNNYEKSWFPRLLKWLDGGSGLLDDAMAHELDEGSEEHLLPDSQDALTRETKFEQHRQESLDKDETLYERYHQWAHTRGKKLLTWLYRLLAVVVCFSIIWVLLQTASYLPPFGNPDNPVNNEVSQRYIEKGMEETGAVNIVAGMILDYRAFDTLGESNVLFIAACSVLILLRVSGSKDGKPSTEQLEAEADDRMYEPKNDAILQHAANFLVPLILMFGVYVILNGHISPGGGFSGGAIMGAGRPQAAPAPGPLRRKMRLPVHTRLQRASVRRSVRPPFCPGGMESAGLCAYNTAPDRSAFHLQMAVPRCIPARM